MLLLCCDFLFLSLLFLFLLMYAFAAECCLLMSRCFFCTLCCWVWCRLSFSDSSWVWCWSSRDPFLFIWCCFLCFCCFCFCWCSPAWWSARRRCARCAPGSPTILLLMSFSMPISKMTSTMMFFSRMVSKLLKMREMFIMSLQLCLLSFPPLSWKFMMEI